eukprot:6187658-Amphidinium_carterae.1
MGVCQGGEERGRVQEQEHTALHARLATASAVSDPLLSEAGAHEGTDMTLPYHKGMQVISAESKRTSNIRLDVKYDKSLDTFNRFKNSVAHCFSWG